MESSADASRKEWRIVTEQSSSRPNEEMDRTKLDQSDERLIFEVQQRGRDQLDADFVLDNTNNNNNILQQRLHAVSKQREDLQQMEIELRAQAIIVGMQTNFNAQLKEHSNANLKLQEQLHEREQRIIELDRRMSDKERELHAVKLDNEAAWAKEDLLREQSKELQSYRRDRDNSEAERAQHIKQIHDLQEHTQEKEHQLLELQEQQRIAQETIIFKDEQLRDAQAWITRAQEVDAFQTTTIQTLQAELRDRTEQYNQLCLVCQRQFAELERFYLHIQQLQLELADLREKSGIYPDGSQSHVTAQINPNDVSKLSQGNGNQLEVNGNASAFVNSASLQNGNSENASPVPPEVNTSSSQADHVQSVGFAPTSILGMPTYLPNGQVTALHPFVMHQQGIPHPSQVTQPPFHSAPAMTALQNWQNQQILPDGQPTHDQYHQQTQQNLPRVESQFEANGQVVNANYLNSTHGQRLEADSVSPSPTGEADSTDKSYENVESQQGMQQLSSQFHDALRMDPLVHGNDNERKNAQPVSDLGLNFMSENSNFSVNLSSSEPQTKAVTETSVTSPSVISSDDYTTGHKNTIVGKSGDEYLLDERALLASVARTIGSGGRIRISSTLPNRLGKMLAPLHWHDYKKKYGKLDNFVASHPELFLIEGDYIQLREGAQEIIAAKAAVAKVAAAASAPSPYSSLLPSVALTPMARSHRSRNASSLESSSMNAADKGVSNVKILSKPKDQGELNSRSALPAAGNGRPSVNMVGKQQSRTVGAASVPRR